MAESIAAATKTQEKKHGKPCETSRTGADRAFTFGAMHRLSCLASKERALALCWLIGMALLAGPARAGTVRLHGLAYEDLRQLAGRFGLKTVWLKAGEEMRLESQWTRIEFDKYSREISLNGLRVFLGDPVEAFRGSFYVSVRDAEATLTPILAPGTGPTPPRLRIIAIDPGHGGADSGTSNRRLGLTEKRLTLDVAQRVEKLLRAAGYTVVPTRTRDRYVDLDRRSELANRAGADLFISIHFNAIEAGAARTRGVETYIMTPRYQTSTQPEKDRDMISQDYPGNRNDFWNAILGYEMHRTLVDAMKSDDRGLKHRRLAVLRGIKCPGVLVEPAYLSDNAVAGKLRTAAFRQSIAEAIVAGVRAYARVVRTARDG